ncbi:hypothetical protein KUL25_14050 [Rhodobacteraceae bacterium N5(2021)]|uniref:Calcium-binding protein n=1 Tax=Gymnodinialimonas phycosphaerae TaxID=2841589 RepID=A0A975TS97_9RHOB|nr:hypothetical protein [Gymnodinialimonas phycosphaerae]MBY4893886.1 hypothetical protein [Gymnodinialimonas phycosphaerae]
MANITGTPGNDLLTGAGSSDSISVLGGGHTIVGQNGNDTISGGAGSDDITLRPGANTASGGGNDKIDDLEQRFHDVDLAF